MGIIICFIVGGFLGCLLYRHNIKTEREAIDKNFDALERAWMTPSHWEFLRMVAQDRKEKEGTK